MRAARELSPRSAAAALAVLAAASAGAGCGGARPAAERTADGAPSPRAVAVSRASGAAAAPERARRRAAGPPARLVIPAIGVSSPLERLGLQPDGRLAPPVDPDRPGWWSGGPRPGRPGAAVIAGHVDSRTGPAVFARLGELRRGDRILVADREGRRSAFRVRSSRRFAKDDFPTQRVYTATTDPVLRLITCAGSFDRASGHYESNLVVFASRAGGWQRR